MTQYGYFLPLIQIPQTPMDRLINLSGISLAADSMYATLQALPVPQAIINVDVFPQISDNQYGIAIAMVVQNAPERSTRNQCLQELCAQLVNVPGV